MIPVGKIILPKAILAEICPYCSRGRSPLDMLVYANGNVRICRECYEIHLKALEGLATGQYTGCCSECGKSVDEVKAIQGDGDNGVRMAVHREGNYYRPMCLACDARYVPKRRDLYGKTQFWRDRGL